MNFNDRTKTGDTPFQNLDAVSALKEISDGSAAIYSGGSAITLFQDDNFKGKATVRSESDRDLRVGPFQGPPDNSTSSITVNSGKWELYQKKDFDNSGWNFQLGEGNYTLSELKKKGFTNDSLSSIRKVA